MVFTPLLDARYRGQAYELTIPLHAPTLKRPFTPLTSALTVTRCRGAPSNWSICACRPSARSKNRSLRPNRFARTTAPAR